MSPTALDGSVHCESEGVEASLAVLVGFDLLTCGSADSGVGAGIDSYYEYLMKAYILLGDDVFLQRFNTVSRPSPSSACPSVCLQPLPACPPPVSHCCARFTALQCHHEIHQSAATAAQRAHAQPHGQRAQLDGFPAGLLPRLAGQEFFQREFLLQPDETFARGVMVFVFFSRRFCEEI